MNSRLLAILLAGTMLFVAPLAEAHRVAGVITSVRNVRDLLASADSLWVATSGGVSRYSRSTRGLLAHYNSQHGLDSPEVVRLAATQEKGRFVLKAYTKKSVCRLVGEHFVCKKLERESRRPGQRVSLDYERGMRVTKRLSLDGATFLGTAQDGAYFDGQALEQAGLPDAHVSALSVFADALYVGTFNGGLARVSPGNEVLSLAGPGPLVNALAAGPNHLFVGTSEGLFQSADGLSFERIDFVEQAVVGLAFDGTSVWASTPGALYRIPDGGGPPMDVWWIPGGSRSLQKVSAAPGWLWLATEDRGAIRMQLSAQLRSRDRPFEVFDRASGLPSSWSLAVAARGDGSALVTTLRSGLAQIGAAQTGQALSLPLHPWGLSALWDGAGTWVGTQGGAAFVPDAALGPTSLAAAAQIEPVEGLPHPCVHALLRDPRTAYRDRIWLGTENGLAWLHAPTKSN